jgi:hypothetical protein
LNEAAQKVDPENRFYGRMKLRRLDAETLRDSILASASELDLTQYGPPVPVARDLVGRIVVGSQKTDGNGDPVGVETGNGSDQRRSIYVQMRRSKPLTVLDTFDLPVMSPNCDSRAVTTVAPQSLLLMNDVFLINESRHLAERLRREFPGDTRHQIEDLWRILYGAPPEANELQKSLNFLAEQGESIRVQPVPTDSKAKAPIARDFQLESLASLCQVLMSANRFLYMD